MHRALLAMSLSIGLVGCAAGGVSDRFIRTPAPPPAAQPQPGPAFVAPRVQQGSGLDSVIGANASALTQRFGETRIDLIEGDARKLQFAAPSCVLDVYLYPLAAGSAPVATHVEARARQGGGAFDRAQCIADLTREAQRR